MIMPTFITNQLGENGRESHMLCSEPKVITAFAYHSKAHTDNESLHPLSDLNQILSYSCALNLALQLHLIATPTKQSSANGSSDWIKSCELVLDEDYISFTRSHPAGLSESLWLRLTRLCRSFSPAVPPYIKPHITPTELSRQANVELVDNEDMLQSELDESIPNGTTSSVLLESAHFGKVNEFSVKEEQLRTHSHTIHQGHSNQTHADQSTPKPMNHDYLTGMYEMSELYDMNDSPEAAEGQTEQYSKSSSEMNKLDRLSMELEEDEVTLFEQPCQSPKVHQTVRRTSILRSADRSCVGSDGEQPSSGIQKRVRFSLGSTHLSPALEAEYGGRSNRRRLLDFARRRQMSAQPNDTPGLCTLFFLSVIYSPLCLLIRCLKQIIYVLLYIRVKFILWSCLLGLLLFPFSLITCWSVLRLPWTQVPDQLIHFGQSHLQLTQSNDSLSGSMQQLCSRFLVWFGRCLTSTPSTDS
ncbi:hypothetical protein P879_06140 [Paragonimus westermani]|uniref:Uncharacterized protein n=1 Tax=Paragonimus westermani TaxID=34504 RepID=A0A8T0DW49_9TREM|nr:hypothetical protein P879_06140 [Paragonimus westermani]